ncbi:hypothetical protein PFLUV_G00079750 [Perca fluviatilis]|uniref:Uncharacterized protein n=1 Tax=Perca fluviatilis TaxID=8168 RepID=A0A6A5FD28_PERFL|nr:hypothetical protein PFLUV_G00079750 [Perca fluviatilis]
MQSLFEDSACSHFDIVGQSIFLESSNRSVVVSVQRVLLSLTPAYTSVPTSVCRECPASGNPSGIVLFLEWRLVTQRTPFNPPVVLGSI